MELVDIKGIGPKSKDSLNKLNIYDVDSLVRYYPFRYNVYHPIDIRIVDTEDVIVVNAKIVSKPALFYFNRTFNSMTFNAECNDIIVKVKIFNRGYLSKLLFVNKYICLIGKYDKVHNIFNASDIKLYNINGEEIEPVYHVVSGIKRSFLSKCISNALTVYDVKDIVPEFIINKYHLMGENEAVRYIHMPKDINSLKQAKIKLKYEELFLFMFKINLLKFKNQVFSRFDIKNVDDKYLGDITSKLKFKLTGDQEKAVNNIIDDFRSNKRMNRLILGDVGSGKTIVSFIAIILNFKCGYQSALLAPTEVLARQHYDNFINEFGGYGLKTALLVGSLSKKEKEDIKLKLKNGDIDLLVGTHAMLEDDVEFLNIGLVVTDEQHRFGVNQRKALQNKGNSVDVLYMSATPIPRTYALTIYGDMDISMIKEKPSGRKDIKTNVYKFKDMNIISSSIEDEIKAGHQVYVVAPLIESEDETELSDLKQVKKTLEDNFKDDYRISILHGKMKDDAKNKTLNDFKEGNVDILISTTVIEVGIDVKNATMMCIFNAERFGLATLHQLRGRVGRNDLQSKCILISDKETDRLHVLEESNDGFYISEKDFELRGSGDLFGIKQSGDMNFKIADIRKDFKILTQCKIDTEEFIKDNIENDFRDYPYYKELVEKLMDNN